MLRRTHFLLLLTLFLIGSLPLSGQVIERVRFSGLQRTEAAILKEILPPVEGNAPTQALLQTNRNRLSNWPSIIAITERLDTLPNGNYTLTYELQEGTSRYPTAVVGGLSNNFWWELGYQDVNWRGRGNTLSAAIRQIDGRTGGRLNYQQRFFRHSIRWGINGNVERYVSEEPLFFSEGQVDYLYRNHSVGGGLTYYFNSQQFLQLGSVVFNEFYRKLDLENPIGPLEQDEYKFLFKLAYQHNNIFNHPTQITGNAWWASSELVLEDNQDVPFLLLRAAWRHYRSVGKKGTFATRFSAGVSTNRATPFAPFVVDSRVNIRGSGNRVDRGTAVLVLNLEQRYVLIDQPLWALQGVAFADIGSWRNPGGELLELLDGSTIRCFAGVGIRTLLGRYRQLRLRADYGWGIHPVGDHGVVFGLGQYF